jgi:hypothetical protein
MINGAHAILYSDDAEATRAALAKVLRTRSVDAGGGWLIFALPPGRARRAPGHGGRPGRAVPALRRRRRHRGRPAGRRGWDRPSDQRPGLRAADGHRPPRRGRARSVPAPPPDRGAIQLSALLFGGQPHPTKPDTPMLAYGTGFSDARRRERHLDWSERHTPVNPAGRLLRLVGRAWCGTRSLCVRSLVLEAVATSRLRHADALKSSL